MPQYHKSVLYTSDILIVKCKERPPSDKRLKGWPISDHPALPPSILMCYWRQYVPLFLSSFQLQSWFRFYTKWMINIVILIFALKLFAWLWDIYWGLSVKHCRGTEPSPVFNSVAEESNSLSLDKSVVSPVSKGCYKNATKEVTC